MFERIYNLKNKKKGFTLVELIVVLVILAILLAILVPSMTGWIKKAKEKQILLNARTVYLACQTVASEEYGKSGFSAAACTANTAAGSATGIAKSVVDLAELKNNNYTFSFSVNDEGQVTKFSYYEGSASDKTVTFDASKDASLVTSWS
jgi:type IV pilus assembly protein PilA